MQKKRSTNQHFACACVVNVSTENIVICCNVELNRQVTCVCTCALIVWMSQEIVIAVVVDDVESPTHSQLQTETGCCHCHPLSQSGGGTWWVLQSSILSFLHAPSLPPPEQDSAVAADSLTAGQSGPLSHPVTASAESPSLHRGGRKLNAYWLIYTVTVWDGVHCML